MKQTLLTSVACLLFSICYSQSISDHFQKIRKNEAELTAFISQMPKGGDLHNHYSGAVYAESYFNWLVEANSCINTQTLEASLSLSTCDSPWYQISKLKKLMGASQFESFRQRVIRSYSTKEWDQVHNDAREEHFFSTFGNFSLASGLNFEKGLQELKERAIAENVSYLEPMMVNIRFRKMSRSLPVADNSDTISFYNKELQQIQIAHDKTRLNAILKNLRSSIQNELSATAISYNQFIDSVQQFVADDQRFSLRFMAFILRNGDPLPTFLNLYAAFYTVQQSATKNLIAVNIVAPEDNPVSMHDYWLHMQFFKFCHEAFPDVKYSMHAGELTEGVVQPEELTWHISSAVYDAGANRIGHGVDIAYEKNNYELLRYMSRNNIAVEINLSSNEYILGVKDDRHPILLYKHFNVPIVISTDDPGVSRSSLTEQYVLLAKRYNEITYSDIKSFVYNSIRYSFNDRSAKEKILKDLDDRFKIFEAYVLRTKN
jgi:hypothetical protein